MISELKEIIKEAKEYPVYDLSRDGMEDDLVGWRIPIETMRKLEMLIEKQESIERWRFPKVS